MFNESAFLFQHATSQGAGFFSWDIAANKLFADKLVAEFFGFPASATEIGMPVENYVERIALEDRLRVRYAIEASLQTSEQRQESYTIRRPDGSSVTVLAFGQSYRSPDGVPLQYSGIIMRLDHTMAHDSSLVMQCLNIFNAAKREGHSEAAEMIRVALALILMGPNATPARH